MDDGREGNDREDVELKEKGNFKYITQGERTEDWNYKWIINEEATKGSNKEIWCK